MFNFYIRFSTLFKEYLTHLNLFLLTIIKAMLIRIKQNIST